MKTTRFAKNTMEKAKDLQTRYNKLGASKRQSVRNFKPMRELVAAILPVLPDPNALVLVERNMSVTVQGKHFTKQLQPIAVPAAAVFPKNEIWEKNGKTVRQLVKELHQQGFTATVSNVSQAFNSIPHLKSVRSTAGLRKRGCPECHYYIASMEVSTAK